MSILLNIILVQHIFAFRHPFPTDTFYSCSGKQDYRLRGENLPAGSSQRLTILPVSMCLSSFIKYASFITYC